MAVTDQQPTKVGQRVQEVFTDTRGWVVYLNENGEAEVEWDVKTSIDEEDRIFPVEALRVVEVICVDADIYTDPSLWNEVEQTTTGTEHGPVYKLKNGMVFKGLGAMQGFLLGYFTRA